MIILLIGETGGGKTSLGVNFGIKAMDNGREDIEIAKQRLCGYRGFSKVKMPKDHLVYSDIYFFGSEDSNNSRVVNFTTGYRFGLPNEDFETDYFPYGSTLIFDEARKYWNARKSMASYENGGIHPKTLEAFELHRHNNLTIILITQLENHIDLNVRSLAHVVIEPYELIQEKIGEKLKRIVTKWKCHKYRNVDDYVLSKKGDKSVIVEDIEYVFNGDIFDCYDSEFFMFQFLHGLKKYSGIKMKPCSGTRDSVKKMYELFCDLRTNYKAKREKVKQDAIQKSRGTTIEYL
ncbi:MAG: hypothetical protein IJB98_02595 [Clostridia bacterium]|nr:hypothetical protein [Clostridia bacterium]